MVNTFLHCLILLLLVQSVAAQQRTPVIKAGSKQIKVLDGDYLQDGELVPELRPDTYVYHRSSKPRKIIFYTDIDSITLDITSGEVYNFAVVLNDKDTCHQKVTFENPNKV